MKSLAIAGEPPPRMASAATAMASAWGGVYLMLCFLLRPAGWPLAVFGDDAWYGEVISLSRPVV